MSPKNKKENLFVNHLKYIALTPFIFFFLYPHNSNTLKAGLEFQWQNNQDFKRLKWFQTDDEKNVRNTIFLFLRASDRKTGLLNVKLKVPDKFAPKIKKEKISFCQVRIGGFTKKTKCVKNIPIDIEIDKDNNSVNIFPLKPIPSSKENYAIVLKVTNPNRGGLYQFHSFGQSSGNIPVSFYLGSWTLKMQSQ